MNEIAKLAVSKFDVSKAVRDAIRPGRYDVDTVFRLKGTINVGEDSEFTPTVAIPIKATLALFVRYCGVTREAALEALQRAMTDALNLGDKGEEHAGRARLRAQEFRADLLLV